MTLREFLIERDIAQRDLARQLGMSKSQFNRCVNGERPWSRRVKKYLPMILPDDTPLDILIEIRLGKQEKASG